MALAGHWEASPAASAIPGTFSDRQEHLLLKGLMAGACPRPMEIQKFLEFGLEDPERPGGQTIPAWRSLQAAVRAAVRAAPASPAQRVGAPTK